MQHSRRIHLLKNRYLDSDKFDINSHYDRKLSYAENKRILDRKAKARGLVKRRSDSVHVRNSPLYFMHLAKHFNKSRSLRSQKMEDRRTNKHTFKASTLTREQFNLWKKYPARFDIIGIDSKEVNPKLRKLLIQTKIDIDRINQDII
jgi:arginyl-tRNA--protein-N-Asp/Glu arginylyltransferase